MNENTTRQMRQVIVAQWCAKAFGADHASSVRQRAVRLLEEAIEAYQAAGASPEMAHRLVDHVFARPVGDMSREIGGVGVTLLALGQACGQDVDLCEVMEIKRVLGKPLAHFRERNAEKNAAGFEVVDQTSTKV